MSTIINQNAAKAFVREKLGCRCPDSVFEQIDFQAHASIVNQDTITKRLLIGNRLLIYLLELEDDKSLPILLPLLVKKAKAERDRESYNRLRVVLVTNQVDSLRPNAERLFASIEEVDPKVHLHVVGREEIGGLI